MKKFIEDFKEFAFKGNIIDMAVGIVIGTAFSAIITKLVEGVISPLIGLLTGGVSLADLAVQLKAAEVANGEVVREALMLNYGAFLQAILDFIIIALCLFFVMKGIMAAKKKMEELKKTEEAPAEEEEPADTELSVLLEIKELLEKKN